MAFDPVSGIFELAAGLFQKRAERRATDRANAESRDAATLAFQRNTEAARLSRKANRKDATVAERRSDGNAKIARRFNAAQADKANRFTAAREDKAFDRSEKRDLRNRDWALDDYQRAKDDLSNQFVDSRAAAEKAGFNPLSVLGSQMTPNFAAGGLSSSSYGAGQGVGASSGFSSGQMAAPGSVPMAYGADVAVQPLASNDAIMGAIREFGREVTGDNALDRQNSELQRDLLQLEIDQRRSGVNPYAAPPRNSVPLLGSGAVPAGSKSATPNWIDPDRPVSITPDQNTSGTFVMDNKLTDFMGGPITIPGQGLDADIDSLIVAGATIAGTGLKRLIFSPLTYPVGARRFVVPVFDGSSKPKAPDVPWVSGDDWYPDFNR